MENINKIYETKEDWGYLKEKNLFLKGLQILAKYTEDITITSGHDEVWAYLEKHDEYEKMSNEDIETLFKAGWRWDSDNEGFAIFV